MHTFSVCILLTSVWFGSVRLSVNVRSGVRCTVYGVWLCIHIAHTYSIATVVCMLSVLKSMHDFVSAAAVVVGCLCLFLFLLFSSHCLLPVSRVVCTLYRRWNVASTCFWIIAQWHSTPNCPENERRVSVNVCLTKLSVHHICACVSVCSVGK